MFNLTTYGNEAMRLLFTLFVLLFTQLFLNMAHASPQTRVSADQRKSHVNQVAPDERRKRKMVAAKTTKKTKVAPVKEQQSQEKNAKKRVKSTELVTRKASSVKTVKTTRAESKAESKKEKTLKTTKAETKADKKSKTRALAKNTTGKISKKEAYGRHRKGKKYRKGKKFPEEDSKPITLSATHKKRYQHVQQTAMAKLMHQVGKPYRWGGTSPNTGFDCSGLVYYAYKDLIRIKMPRTANKMYHLRDAAPVKRGELESGDLVFFRINNRGAADHVGVYVGNGKFIQSPRTGENIKITSLSDDYWQDHYVGARRVMTPKMIR